ncbi:MAG: hypothetical protein KAY32_00925 [Candidatus Eisenbacteria sp.]|nr:hypothetical protein [Candidatus Eisenbacteria bacterium]
MHAWIRSWAQIFGVAGAALMMVAGVALGLSVPAIVLRSLVVGGVLYAAVLILGRLVGHALLRVIVTQRVAHENHAQTGSDGGAAGLDEQKRAA